MDTQLPGIVVVGASGFIGRHFIEAIAGKYRIFCLARRSQQEAGIPDYENLRWTQVDIAIWDTMREVVQCIKSNGGAHFVLHLAGYYDFGNRPNPEYQRTNIDGTRNVLKLTRQLGVKRFLFASSLAASKFPRQGECITEDSAVDAEFPYAVSKRAGEEMMQEYQEWFPCTIIRLAAVFSDWCEYPPLYVFLKTWLSKNWNARVIGGKGQSAITYIHIHDLIKCFLQIIKKSQDLPRLSVFIASPSGTVTHNDLYHLSTQFYFGQDVKALHMPRYLATIGVAIRQWIGDIRKKPPFERLWMMEYIDKQLVIDASKTYRLLDWQPTPRLEIARRLLFIIEKMNNQLEAWVQRNEVSLRRIAQRPNLIISHLMDSLHQNMVNQIIEYISGPECRKKLPRYQEMTPERLKWYVELLYQLTSACTRITNRSLIINYARILAHRRFVEGFEQEEVCQSISCIGKIISSNLHMHPDMANHQQRIYEHIGLTFQMLIDEIEDSYEELNQKSPEYIARLDKNEILKNVRDLENIVHDLEDICLDSHKIRQIFGQWEVR